MTDKKRDECRANMENALRGIRSARDLIARGDWEGAERLLAGAHEEVAKVNEVVRVDLALERRGKGN